MSKSYYRNDAEDAGSPHAITRRLRLRATTDRRSESVLDRASRSGVSWRGLAVPFLVDDTARIIRRLNRGLQSVNSMPSSPWRFAIAPMMEWTDSSAFSAVFPA
jgi:hypothetical protein